MKNSRGPNSFFEFGILNIDKPSGPTSFGIVDFIKKEFGLRKASHFGTLDPKVTGVLPIALNRACKLTNFFISHDKEYIGIMRVHEDIELDKIKKEIKKNFLGVIKQTPPVRSRVKRQEREREIYEFELLEKDGKDILFRVKCQGGTYIRKLIDDLGKELGIGAHMLELRRTSAGIFSEEDKEFRNLYELKKAFEEYKKGNPEEILKMIIPAEEAIKKILPEVQVKKIAVERLYTGKVFRKEDLVKEVKLKKETEFAAFEGKRFVGIYKVINGKEIFATPEFVMQPLGN
jgi:H/ACA ribonucleoprotein complex subunit 4